MQNTFITLRLFSHSGFRLKTIKYFENHRFVTLSGTDVIVAHRLMKNSVPSNEYLLLTEKLIKNLPDSDEHIEMEWTDSSEEFASIGKINYQFTLLSEAGKNIPAPPMPDNYYKTGNSSYLVTAIAAYYKDGYTRQAGMDTPPAKGRSGYTRRICREYSSLHI